ncbi:MAG: type I methionyl aminopeptidase [Candidatus Levyibacteriota bacterium]
MITIKSKQDLEKMAQGGKILSGVITEVLNHLKVGVSELELDKLAQDFIIKRGGEPGFKKVPGYNYTLCTSTNDAVVHGIPTNYRFKEDDVAGIDCGVFYKGFNTDACKTKRVLPLNKNDKVDKFLKTGEKALEEAIKMAVVGNRIGHISKTIQEIVEGNGYSVVRRLIGHGVGKNLHEKPGIPGFLDGTQIEKTPALREGMTIAIEVIYNMGKSEVVLSGRDNWTIVTKDGSLSAVFEHTVAVTKEGPIILTA